MRLALPLILLISIPNLLAGCSSSSEGEAKLANALKAERAANQALRSQNADLRNAKKVATPTKAVPLQQTGPMDDIGPNADPEQDALDRQRAVSAKACWHDYCPCDEHAASDRLLCKRLKRGEQIDDVEMEAGAKQRDAHIEMDRWNSEHPDQTVDYP